MSVAYWMKNENVEVNAAISDHEEVMQRLVELMDTGGNLSYRDNYENYFSLEIHRTYTDSFKELKPIETGLRDLFSTSTSRLRFIDGVVIIATTCDGVKMPGISAIAPFPW